MDDLIVRRARLVRPPAGKTTNQTWDVAFDAGRIAAIERDAGGRDAKRVIDAEEAWLAPGLIDIHVHAWWGVSYVGIDIDERSIDRGVTTVIDAGSAGSNTFRAFHRHVLTKNRTRTLAFLNISGLGILDGEVGEAQDLRWCRVEPAVKTGQSFSDSIVGIKARLTRSISRTNDLVVLKLALDAASQLGKPVMVHIGDTEHSLDEILQPMRAGDIVTHCYTGWPDGILDPKGRVRESVRAARARGVLFDVGHGRGSFTFEVAERAIEQGFAPSTISSDLHSLNVDGPVFDLVTTLAKLISLGIPLVDVVDMATRAPAQAVGIDDVAGRIEIGAVGDAMLFRERSGSFVLQDAFDVTRRVDRILEPVLTIQRGRLVAGGTPTGAGA